MGPGPNMWGVAKIPWRDHPRRGTPSLIPWVFIAKPDKTHMEKPHVLTTENN